MRGGKLVGQGSYGCVYHPGFRCAVERNERNDEVAKSETIKKRLQRRVSKILPNDFFSNHEYQIGKQIQDIPEYKQYFSPVLSKCPVNKSIIEKYGEDVDKCKVIREDNLVMMNSQYIRGKTPYYWIESIPYQTRINSFKHFCRYIMTAIGKLEHNNIVHHDIKQSNVIVRPSGNPVLVDFGLSLDMTQMNQLKSNPSGYENIVFYAPDYQYWTLDFQVLGLLNENKKLEDHGDEIVDGFIEKGLRPWIDDEFIEEYKVLMREKLREYERMDTGEMIENAIKTWQHWDVHCTAITIITLLGVFQSNGWLPEHKDVDAMMNWALWGIHPIAQLDVKEWRKVWRDTVEK